jgi:Cu(I)/Ag(I) efflux system membrane fusion protein
VRARRATAVAASALLWLAACGKEDASPAEHAGHEMPRAAEAPAPAHDGPPGMAVVEVPAERRQLLGVRTAPVGVRPLVREIRTVGVVAADERRVRRIQSKVSGWVEELFVSFTGEPVRAGQPVLAVYSPELVASQREYLLALAAALPGADPLLEAARMRLRLYDVSDAQIAELERSREPRRRVVLHSPISGFVTVKSVSQGAYIMPESELYTVTDLSLVWVWAVVNEDEIPLVTLGQRAAIDLPAAPGLREASVTYLQPTVDTETRTLRVRFELDNPDGALRPGMYATVRIEQALGEVLALPNDAVIDTGVRRVVFVETAPGTFAPREVSLGRYGDGYYEVLGGLTAGEQVVVSAQFLLDSESRLRGAGGPGHGAH